MDVKYLVVKTLSNFREARRNKNSEMDHANFSRKAHPKIEKAGINKNEAHARKWESESSGVTPRPTKR